MFDGNTIQTPDGNHAARDTKRINAYDQHPRATARALRSRDYGQFKAGTTENGGAVISNITLSASTVSGAAAASTPVGTVAVVGGAPTITTTLVNNGSGNFKLVGSALQTAVTPIPAGSYPITIQAKDGAGQIFGKSFAITVT